MTWDFTYSDDATDRSGSANIGVSDGYGPFLWEIVGGYGFTLGDSETTGTTNILYADSGACGTSQIKVTDMCQTEIVGSVTCEQLPLMTYDWANSGQTCGRPDNVFIQISGGTPPYIWDISGTGFSIQSVQTYGITNTVYASSAACGTATITIEDACGTQVDGSIRCTASGVWVEIERASNGDTACGAPDKDYIGDWSTPVTWCTSRSCLYTKLFGGYKIEENLGRSVYQGPCGAAGQIACIASCDTWVSGGCTYCLADGPTSRPNECRTLSWTHENGSFPFCDTGNGCSCWVVCDRIKYEWGCP
jgi:hypothetical protein